MKSIDIYENIKYLRVFNELNVEINCVSIDTRKIQENDLYIGIKGEKYNGNLFYKDAFEKGAVLAVLDEFDETDEIKDYLKENKKSIILVKDSVLALGELAKYKRSLFKKPVVAITGSAGKTSTKDMIYSVLNESFNAHKTIGNQNNHIGLPLTILSMDDKNDILVIEMGMNHLKEISYLTNIAKPDVAVITNVGSAHIGLLGSRENILKAKLEILEGLNETGTLVINNDNDLLHEWYLQNKNNYNIKTFGFINKSDYFANSIIEEENSSEFTCNGSIIKVPMGGEHFIYNALAALSVGNIFNVPNDKIQKGITNFELSRNRMNIIKNAEANITVIDDCYNSNFDSLSYSIKYLSTLHGRRIAVLGSMLELGSYSVELHSNIGELIAKEGIDILITVGNYTEYINDLAIKLGLPLTNSYHFSNNIDAIEKINSIKTSGDKILVKASLMLNFKEI
ncbi:MAG: UDP-N-acetylmuramoyl-tripeptide--D-alanyl-D-alanine ligase, partial [Bacilli bacterium]